MVLWTWVFAGLATLLLVAKLLTSGLLDSTPAKPERKRFPLLRLGDELWTGGETGFHAFHAPHNATQIKCQYVHDHPFEPGTCFLWHSQSFVMGDPFQSDAVVCHRRKPCAIALDQVVLSELPFDFSSPLNYPRLAQLVANATHLLPSHALHVTATFRAQGEFVLEYHPILYAVAGHFTNLNTGFSPTTFHELTFPLALPAGRPDGLVKIVPKDPHTTAPLRVRLESSFTLLQ